MSEQAIVPVTAASVPAEAATPPPPPGELVPPELKAFSDVPINLSIEIGRLQVFLGELVGLKPGRIFKIAKAVGEPFDICANRQPVARGEVIVVENSAGVRITEVLKL